MKAFELKGLVKNYSEFTLGELDLSLEPGTVMGYIGPNGAGKSTTMHCMVGLVKPERGIIKIFDKATDPNKIEWKLDIGYVGDKHCFYENWSVEKNLKFIKQFYPNWSDNLMLDLVRRFDIKLDKKAKNLSTGNRVKLSLINALSHNPKLLILDEPTTGLDPVVRTELLDLLFEVVEEGERSIFYSTHILTDISRIADDLAFLKNGQLHLLTAKDDLTENYRKISFKLNETKKDLADVISQVSSGDNHKVVSGNFKNTIEHLKQIGAENIEEARMSIDEIAVEILKDKKVK